MARAHMARAGAAGLSLRAVASELGLSSAAIYYYYANRDALITDLLVDAWRTLGAAIGAADPGPAHDVAERLLAAMLAYRAWALAAPAEFELLFGAPIPGYHAPAEITAPEARAALRSFGTLFAVAQAAGRLRMPAPAPPAVAAHAAEWARTTEQAIPLDVLAAMLWVWGLGHGLVALELNGQLQPIIGDPAAFFALSSQAALRALGVIAASESAPDSQSQ